MSETNEDYIFNDEDIWTIDSRMTAFAADVKASNWTSVDETSDMQVLKLNRLIFDDQANETEVLAVSGKDNAMNWIFLRPDARNIWDQMYCRLLRTETARGGAMILRLRGFFTVSGNSGIGKSYSMIYILKKFLDAGKVIFYDFRKAEKLYAFIPKKDGDYGVYRTLVHNVQKGPKTSFFLKSPGTVFDPVLWDPAETDEGNFEAKYLWNCRTVVAVSVKEELVKNAYKDYETAKLYITQWSLEHLETVRQLCFSDRFSAEQLRYRYFRYGGIYRLVFGEVDVLNEFNDKVTESIAGLTQEALEAILDGNIMGKFKEISSGIFEVKPAEPRGREFNFGSPYVYALLAGKFWQYWVKHGKGENPRYTEWFEAMGMLRLAEGGTFKVKKLGEASTDWEDLVLRKVPIETIEPTNGKEVDNDAFYQAWAKSEGGAMLAPSWGMLPVVDCADARGRGYNTTVSRQHGIEYGPCEKILGLHQNLKLYFAVPDWMAEDFKKQSFDGVAQHEHDKRNRISSKVEQYVLKIESQHIETLKEMFLKTEERMQEEFSRRLEVVDCFRKRRRIDKNAGDVEEQGKEDDGDVAVMDDATLNG